MVCAVPSNRYTQLATDVLLFATSCNIHSIDLEKTKTLLSYLVKVMATPGKYSIPSMCDLGK